MARATNAPSTQDVKALAKSDGFVVVLVPEQPFRDLTEVAKSAGMSVSEALSQAINDWIAALGKSKKP